MAKGRETSTDRVYDNIGANFGEDKKPSWVNLAQLDTPMEDSLANGLIYKPALRFHGLTGGLWGASALSEAPSLPSDRPPSYKMVESMKSRSNNDGHSDVDPIYKSANISAISPLTLRKRNTMAVVLVAVALLAAAATITGVSLHFLHPKSLLRANVRFTIANRNFSDEMVNSTSVDFQAIEYPLCESMDDFFLTSELAEFYLGCKVVSLRNDDTRVKNGTAVHFNLDFVENSVTNDGERIKKIIMRRSGRHKTDDTLYLVIREFLVYLRSLRVDLEVLPLPNDRKPKVKIPWNRDIDFISSKSHMTVNNYIITETYSLTNTDIGDHTLTLSGIRSISKDIPRFVLPDENIRNDIIHTHIPLHIDATSSPNMDALYLSKNVHKNSVSVLSRVNVLKRGQLVGSVGDGLILTPTKSILSHSSDKIVSHFDKIPDVKSANEALTFKHRMVFPVEFVQPKLTIQPTQPDLIQETQANVVSWTIKDKTMNMGNAFLQTSFEDILTNAADINGIATEELFTQTHELNTHPLPEYKTSPKVTTVSSDMFLIQGSRTFTNFITDVGSTEQVSSDQVHHSPIVHYVPILNEIQERIVDINKVSNTKKSDTTNSYVKLHPYSLDEQNEQNMKLTTTERPYSKSSDRSAPLSLAKRMDAFDQTVFKDESVMQLNEFVDVALESTHTQNAPKNIDWINIFNEPRPTSIQHVGRLPEFNQPTINEDGTFVDTNTEPDKHTQSPPADWINIFNQQKETSLQYVGDLRDKGNDKNTNDQKGLHTELKPNNRKENNVIVVVRKNKSSLNSKADKPFVISPLDNTNMDFVNLENGNNIYNPTNGENAIPNNLIIGKMTTQDSVISKVEENRHENYKGNTIVVQNLENEVSGRAVHSKVSSKSPTFHLVRRIIDGQYVLVLRKTNAGEQFESDITDGFDRQTQIFLHNIGINLTASSLNFDSSFSRKTHNNNQNAVGRQPQRVARIHAFHAPRVTRNDRPNPRQNFWRPLDKTGRRKGTLVNRSSRLIATGTNKILHNVHMSHGRVRRLNVRNQPSAWNNKFSRSYK